LPGGLAVWREFDELVVRPVSSDSLEAELDAEHSQVEIGGFTLILTRKVPGSSLRSLLEDARQKREAGRDWMMAVLDDSRLPERLGVRGRLPGERAAVSGHRSAKKLKNLMIDHRIPSSRRASWPVVATREGQYVWSPGLPPANKFAAGVESPRLAVIEASES
jgi:tRNA(Ile)-lysidine synthase